MRSATHRTSCDNFWSWTLVIKNYPVISLTAVCAPRVTLIVHNGPFFLYPNGYVLVRNRTRIKGFFVTMFSNKAMRLRRHCRLFHCNNSIYARYFQTFYLCFMSTPITISPNIQSGEPVFSNTRVPVRNLFDYLKAGHSLNEFLEDFPSVSKEQAVQVIEHFENLLQFQQAQL